MEAEVLFKVVAAGGHQYVAYTNGEIEGFGDGAIAINRYPSLLMSALAHSSVEREAATQSITDDIIEAAIERDRKFSEGLRPEEIELYMKARRIANEVDLPVGDGVDRSQIVRRVLELLAQGEAVPG